VGRVNDVLQGYTTLASSLLERWGALASKAASRVDAGEYDVAGASEDATAGVKLATEGGMLWAAEAVEAACALGGFEAGPERVTSQPFHAPAGASLKLFGPLVKGPSLEATMPVSVLSIHPPQLGPRETEFTLRAEATGLHGATYVGKVEATTDAGTTPVTVWITVP